MLHAKTAATQTVAYPGDRIRDGRLNSQQMQAHLLLVRQGRTPQLLHLIASIEAQLAKGGR